jgi:phosphosulfolactate synthase (CoM biosynthesis protein A)
VSEEARMPALYGHCVRVYNALLQEAQRVEEAGVEMIVWEGFPTTFFREKMDLSTPYYTFVRRALIRMGCIRMLRRGGSTTPSQWELIREPDPDKFLEVNVKEPTVRELQQSVFEQALRDLGRRVERLEASTGLHRIPLDYTRDLEQVDD